MQKITFKDYEKAIKAKYEIEKEGEYANNFNPTAQANLRDLCWERLKENESKDDLSTFFSFFTFNFEVNAGVKKKLKEETDRFKTIASFYLKEDKKTASRYAVELAAILVDFQPRPYNKFSKAGIILPKEKPIEGPKIPFAFSIEDDKNEQEKGKPKQIEQENQNEAIFKEELIANNQLGFFGKLNQNKVSLIAIITLSLIASYFVFFNKGCMQWSDSHYEVVYCEEGIEGNPNEIIQYDSHLLDFKKIPVCDTTIWFANGKSIIWYAKTNNKVDFFTTCGNGRHPESGSTIRPVTKHIFNKYKKPCGSK